MTEAAKSLRDYPRLWSKWRRLTLQFALRPRDWTRGVGRRHTRRCASLAGCIVSAPEFSTVSEVERRRVKDLATNLYQSLAAEARTKVGGRIWLGRALAVGASSPSLRHLSKLYGLEATDHA